MDRHAAASPDGGDNDTSPEVKGVSGKYFVDKNAVPSDRATYDLETARRLWDLSVEITGVDYHLEKA
jgi:hypothetical protein